MAIPTEQFLAQVNQACPGLDPKTAPVVTAITVRAICERLAPAQAAPMAAQLSDALAEAAQAGGQDQTATGLPIPLIDFYQLLVIRAELNNPTARQVAHAVAQTLHQTHRDMALALPCELGGLLARSP